MVSLWHAFDLAASLGSNDTGNTRPRVAASRAWPVTPWLKAELLTPDEAKAHEPHWRDLAARALIPNLFGEPEIALAAATHLLHGQSPRFLFVWDDRAHPEPRLILSVPLVLPAFGVGEARLWSHEEIASSIPLIDRDDAEGAMDALLEAIRLGPARASGLALTRLDEGSVFADLVKRAAARGGREILRFERPLRAAPVRASARLRAEHPLRISVARSPRRVREAVEHFLAIEALGPAGLNGEALLLSPQACAFLRVATRSLARRKACHVVLRLAQGRPVGADIYLRAGGKDVLWKRAGLENATRASQAAPATDRLAQDRSVRAAGTSPVSVDWLIPANPGRSPAILALAARDAFSRRLRQMMKRVVRRT